MTIRIITFLLFSSFSLVKAGVCPNVKLDSLFNKADCVFIGTITKIECSTPLGANVTDGSCKFHNLVINVKKSYKGSLTENIEVLGGPMIWGEENLYGAFLENGNQYLFFANYHKGKLETYRCNGNFEIDKSRSSQKKLDKIQKLANKKKQSEQESGHSK